MKKLLVMLMACIFVISLKNETLAATDLDGHYARAQVEHWISMGYISGYPDGTVKPDNNISRAEFYSVVNRAFGYYQLAPISFNDVAVGTWYYQDISKAVAAGYIPLEAEAKPNQKITREEVAVIISHVANMTPYDPGADVFNDVAGSWRKPYIGAVAAAGIMRGYGDGTFRPYATITRAETVVSLSATLNRSKGIDLSYVPPIESTLVPISSNSNTAYNPLTGMNVGSQTSSTAPLESGFRNYSLAITKSTYGSSREDEDIYGNVLVDSNSCSIKNISISGDLVFSSNVKGSVSLADVYVSGSIYVFGSPSITMESSEAEELVISSARNDAKVVIKRQSDIPLVRLYSGASLTESGISGIYSGFQDVIMEPEMPSGAKVTLSGGFVNVDIFSSRSSFSLTGGSIETIVIDEMAERGTYNIASGTVVDYVDICGKNSSFTGSGRIKTADVREKGVSFSRKPETVFGEYGNSNSGSGNWNDGYGECMLDIFVADSTGYPIENARVSVYNDRSNTLYASGTTGYDGTFIAWVGSGDYYTITVRYSGYSDEIYTMRMSNCDEKVTIKMGSSVSKANIDVYVQEYSDSGGTATLKDARVSLKTSSGTVLYSESSSQSGLVRFSSIEKGSYIISIEKAAYMSQSVNAEVTESGRDSSYHVTLTKTAASNSGVTP